MDVTASILTALMIYLMEWVPSEKRREKYYDSSLYGISSIIGIVYIIFFFGFSIMSLIESSGFRFWMLAIIIVSFAIIFASNVKNYFRSKREEKSFVNTVNHLISLRKTESFSISELQESTKIRGAQDIERLFDLSQKYGNIPNSIILIEQTSAN